MSSISWGKMKFTKTYMNKEFGTDTLIVLFCNSSESRAWCQPITIHYIQADLLWFFQRWNMQRHFCQTTRRATAKHNYIQRSHWWVSFLNVFVRCNDMVLRTKITDFQLDRDMQKTAISLLRIMLETVTTANRHGITLFNSIQFYEYDSTNSDNSTLIFFIHGRI